MKINNAATKVGLASVALLLAAACGSTGGTDPGASASATPTPKYSSSPCNSPEDKQPSGLIIQDLTCGTGPEAKKGDVITVDYTGSFENGQVFDTSKGEGRDPFPLQLGAGQVIKGWDIGLEGMRAGGTRKLTIPPELGYGPNDYQGIPGGSTLIFEVDLLDVESAGG
jgi:FKBP-type peptidyl-prolyl cis-trans isomerase